MAQQRTTRTTRTTHTPQNPAQKPRPKQPKAPAKQPPATPRQQHAAPQARTAQTAPKMPKTSGTPETPLTRLLGLLRSAPDLTALAVMAVLGLGVSIYLTTVHYAGVPLVCTTTGVIDCSGVTTSAYSVLPGTNVPITIPGMLWFVASGALAVFALVRRARMLPEPTWLRPGHLLLAGVGLAFVLYLVYAEIVLLHRICEWCTVVHVLTLGTFLVALYRIQSQPSQPAYQ